VPDVSSASSALADLLATAAVPAAATDKAAFFEKVATIFDALLLFVVCHFFILQNDAA